MVNGKRRRFFFKKKSEADTKAELLRIERRNVGLASFDLSDSERADAAKCLQLLKPHGKTLLEAVEYFLPHVEALNKTLPISQVISEFLQAKSEDDLSKRYLQDLDSRLRLFDKSFGPQLTASISTADLDDWLRSLRSRSGSKLAGTSRNNFRRVLSVFFEYAVSRNYCRGNPVPKTAQAKETEHAIGILTVDQLSLFLLKLAREMVPFVAIGAFAGLRRAELERLDWCEIDLDSLHIEIKAAKAKSARRRLIKIRPNLREWLLPYRRQSGPVVPQNYNGILEEGRVAAGILAWPPNALRHSFASYCLAHECNAASLALELGHTNSQLIFSHYRELVKPAEASKYWQIIPKN